MYISSTGLLLFFHYKKKKKGKEKVKQFSQAPPDHTFWLTTFCAAHMRRDGSGKENQDEPREPVRPRPGALMSFLRPVGSPNIAVEGLLTSEGPCEELGESLLDTRPSWTVIQYMNRSDHCREGEHSTARIQRPEQGDQGEGSRVLPFGRLAICSYLKEDFVSLYAHCMPGVCLVFQ